nr:hypothetical protein [Tanacetum cinerariifolium]
MIGKNYQDGGANGSYMGGDTRAKGLFHSNLSGSEYPSIIRTFNIPGNDAMVFATCDNSEDHDHHEASKDDQYVMLVESTSKPKGAPIVDDNPSVKASDLKVDDNLSGMVSPSDPIVQSVDINTKLTSYAGAAGASAKD